MNTPNIPAIPDDFAAIMATGRITHADRRRIEAAVNLGHCWPADHYDSREAGLIAAAMDHAHDAVNSTGEARAYSLGMATAYERMAREEIARVTETDRER